MKRIVWAALVVALLPFVAQRSATQDLQSSQSPSQQRSALLERISTNQTISRRTANAFTAVPRQQFLPAYLARMAYQDSSLPVGGGQMLPSPSDLLRAIEALDVRPTDTVLIVGADSGYAAALLGQLAAHVYDVELVASARSSSERLFSSLGYSNITVSGTAIVDSLSSSGPFDRILIHGATPQVPQTIFTQLGQSGKMVVPLRDPTGFQMLMEFSRRGGATTISALGKGFFSPIQLNVGR